MKRENRRVLISILLATTLLFTTGFGSSADNSQPDTQEVETVNHEVKIAPLTDTIEQIPEVAEKVVEKAEKKAAKKAEKKEEKKTEEKTSSKVNKSTPKKYRAKQNKPISATVSETKLLAALIYCEAGNQPYKGQVAVGAVVMNRIASKKYPNTMRKVIYQKGQFGPAITGWLDRVLAENKIPKACYKAAKSALRGNSPVGDCLYFGCGNYGVKIGDHWFH